ncbi:hypothetical protein EJ04DRAFT_579390 [Polyplosphaeria fusca]|uniref:BTB domain-containing protein n=1 Tax=Polyplosphaeria fusca TaxID=682080 RepID=A0A9P4QT04_9PLEO|nr:hypothetical protein EJ04DRAFT_579390 [Polyplosphaeria fusca]
MAAEWAAIVAKSQWLTGNPIPDPPITGPVIEVAVLHLKDPNLTIPQGTVSELFYVHRDVLTATSPRLRDAVEQEMDGTGRLRLPGTWSNPNPSNFAQYVQWLYRRRLRTKSDPSAPAHEWNTLVDAYTLGEKLLDVPFQNAVLKHMVVLSTNGAPFPSLEEVNVLYDHTSHDDPARRLFVDQYTVFMEDNPGWSIDKIATDCNREFVADLLRAFVKVVDEQSSAAPPVLKWEPKLEDYMKMDGRGRADRSTRDDENEVRDDEGGRGQEVPQDGERGTESPSEWNYSLAGSETPTGWSRCTCPECSTYPF